MKNNFSTKLYSIFFGKKVGVDAFGNSYFTSKKNDLKRWVLYKKQVDPTAISVEWQLWLNSNAENTPAKSNNDFAWQKARLPNQTGSDKAYHPRSRKYDEGSKKEKSIDNKIWRPKNEHEK